MTGTICYAFCPDADAAWRAVGLAHARDDHEAYTLALKAFGEHLKPLPLPAEKAA